MMKCPEGGIIRIPDVQLAAIEIFSGRPRYLRLSGSRERFSHVRRGRGRRGDAYRGSVMMKVDPLWGLLLAVIVPLCRLMIFLQMASPIPVPGYSFRPWRR